jgi:hypothetical protein
VPASRMLRHPLTIPVAAFLRGVQATDPMYRWLLAANRMVRWKPSLIFAGDEAVMLAVLIVWSVPEKLPTGVEVIDDHGISQWVGKQYAFLQSRRREVGFTRRAATGDD